MSTKNDTHDTDRLFSEFPQLSHDEKTRLWEEQQRVTGAWYHRKKRRRLSAEERFNKAIRRVWITLALVVGLVLLAVTAFANVSTDLNVARELVDWKNELTAFESRLTQEQQAMFQALSDADKKVMMSRNLQRQAEQDTRHQAGLVDLYRQDVNNSEYATHQARNVNADLMRQVDTALQQAKDAEFQAALTNEHQVKAYGYADKPTGGANIVQTAPRQIVNQGTWRNVEPGLSDRHTSIQVFQPAPIIRQVKGRASLNHEIRGDDFSAALTIPEDTSADTLQVLKSESNNITDRYREKLGILHEKNVMMYNTDVYTVQTARQVALGWLSLPLLTICSLCGVYVFRSIKEEQHKRLKIELGEIDGGAR